MNKAEVLAALQRGREKLMTALGRVPDEKMNVPALYENWTVKDFIAHIGFWESRASYLFEMLLCGEVLTEVITEDMTDKINAEVLAKNKDLPLEFVRAREKAAYEKVYQVVENAAEPDLIDPQRFAWTNGYPFFMWIAANTYEHYDVHLPDLLVWLEKMGL